MKKPLSADQLNKMDQSELIRLVLSQQEEIQKLDNRLQKFMEEVADANRHRYGRSSEAFETDGQISFCEGQRDQRERKQLIYPSWK